MQLQIGLKVHRSGKSDLAAQLWITSVLAPSSPVSSASDAFVRLGFFWYKNVTFYQKKTNVFAYFYDKSNTSPVTLYLSSLVPFSGKEAPGLHEAKRVGINLVLKTTPGI